MAILNSATAHIPTTSSRMPATADEYDHADGLHHVQSADGGSCLIARGNLRNDRVGDGRFAGKADAYEYGRQQA